MTEGCQTCATSTRKGWVWMPRITQWVECWGCNHGVDPASNITVMQGGSRPRIDVLTYTNSQRRPYMRSKSNKPYVCVKCGVRAYQPAAVCQETGCVGSVVKMEVMHIRVIPHGKMHDILVFMHLLHAGDPEWVNPKTCKDCESVIINCPTLNQQQMFKLAKQVGLKKLKIKKWWPEEKCKEKHAHAVPVL